MLVYVQTLSALDVLDVSGLNVSIRIFRPTVDLNDSNFYFHFCQYIYLASNLVLSMTRI